MSGIEIVSASEALRELARWVVRDGVDSDRLAGYMQRLIDRDLIELDASCRFEAARMAKSSSHLSSQAVAAHLSERALVLEREVVSVTASRPSDQPHQSAGSYSDRGDVRPVFDRQIQAASIRPRRLTFLPELLAALACAVVGWVLLHCHGDGSHLRLLSATTYCILAVIYLLVASYTRWHSAHPHR